MAWMVMAKSHSKGLMYPDRIFPSRCIPGSDMGHCCVGQRMRTSRWVRPPSPHTSVPARRTHRTPSQCTGTVVRCMDPSCGARRPACLELLLLAAVGMGGEGFRLVRDPREAKTYEELCTLFNPSADQDEVGGWYFNGVSTVIRKAQWAKQRGLAGVMVWEAGQDSRVQPQSLLQALSDFRA
eukprot:GGOE01002753.1.p1 GENE.GGOE01002753.1~~GGOE01002753.1.p1  ORF type:complete len:182 (+),score=14.56 GGOE01002753.1:255-800(+)